MSDFSHHLNFFNVSILTGLFLLFIIGLLISSLLGKNKRVKGLEFSLAKLMRSFNELDEQAKLIVKTDLELNKAQEELDKRLNSLDALQRISRLISTTLDEDEIFNRLNQPFITELRFEKHLLLMFDENQNLHCRIKFGFSDEETAHIISSLSKDQNLLSTIKERHILSSVNCPAEEKERVTQLINVEHFILTAILSQNLIIGIIFVGNQSGASAVTDGDEELLSILAGQIGQAIDNARLFEEVYRSRQSLESKVQERTKQLASAFEEVKRISQKKSEFISAVSHELRTPLTSIKGYAAILMSGKIGEVPLKVKERLERVNKQSDNLVKLINSLLDISRIESGRVEMKLKEHDIASLIDNVHDLLTPQLKEKNIHFVVDIPENIPQVKIDLPQYERVFINLVANAIKFTPQEGTISIKAQSQKGATLFMISDTGIGIPEDDLKRLFDEFYRVDNEINKNVKGTGLGLALAKNIVEAHKGKIWITSKVNEGTTFHFTLPSTS